MPVFYVPRLTHPIPSSYKYWEHHDSFGRTDGYGVKMVLNDQHVLILPGERKEMDLSGFAPSPAKKTTNVSTSRTAYTSSLSMMPLNPAPSMQPVETSSKVGHDENDGVNSGFSGTVHVVHDDDDDGHDDDAVVHDDDDGAISNSSASLVVANADLPTKRDLLVPSPKKRGRPRSKQNTGSNKKVKTRSSRNK